MHGVKNIFWSVGLFLVCATVLLGQAQTRSSVLASDAATTATQPPESDSPATSSTVAAGPPAVVPRLMKFSGVLNDASGKPLTGTVDITFSLYNAESGGSPLWFETQTVQADELGRYTALIGVMHTDGLPIDLFTSGEVRWLGIQVSSEAEQQPRVLLVSVPYALKAGDAETLGGKPASAYMLSNPQNGTAGTIAVLGATTSTMPVNTGGNNKETRTANNSPATTCTSVTSDGLAAVNSIALFTTACNVESSVLTQYNGNLGFGIATPQARLHIFGSDISDADARFNFILGDSTPATAGVGGGIDFSGYYSGTTLKAGFANIRGVKENATQGDYASALIFDTRANGGNQTERMRISSAGNLGLGTSAPAHKLDVAGDINAVTTGTLTAIVGTNSGTANDGVDGFATNAAGTGAGVYGESDSTGGYGVYGYATATSGTTFGVYGLADSVAGVGVYGHGAKWAGYFAGNVYSSGSMGIGMPAPAHRLDVAGDINAITSGTLTAIVGTNAGTANDGVDGFATNAAGTGAGVYGESDSTGGYGVFGYAAAASGTTFGVYGLADSAAGIGVYGHGTKWAGYFAGDVYSNGHVGIGTATPAANLEVNGTTKFDGLVTFASNQVFPHGAIFDATNLFNNYPSINPAYIRIDGTSSATATEALRGSIVPTACTAANLTVSLGSAGSLMVILRVNGASTALGCTISAATACTDSVHTVAVSPGNLLSIQLVGGSTGNMVYTAFTCS